MIRGVLIFGGLMLVFLIGTWTQVLRRENQELKDKVQALKEKLAAQNKDYSTLYNDFLREESMARHGGESNQDSKLLLRQQLAAENAKLAELQKTLDALPFSKNPQADQAQAHIADDKGALKSLQAQINDVNDDSKAVSLRSKAYRDQTLSNIQQQRNGLKAQLQSLEMSLQSLRTQLQAAEQMNKRDPNRAPQIEQLKSQRDGLNQQKAATQAQIHQLDLTTSSTNQAINNEVNVEKNEVSGDRQRLQVQIGNIKGDMEKWRGVANSSSAADRAASGRRASVLSDITLEKTKIGSLQKMLQALDGQKQ